MPHATVIIGKCMAPAGNLLTPADRAVLELGIDRFPDRPEVYCVAPDDAARRYALAAGAARVDVLSNLAAVSAGWVLVGPGCLAEFGDWLPAALAEQLDAALAFDILDIVAVEGNSLIVLRGLGSGDRDELAVTAPAVLVFAPQLVPSRYVSRYRQSAVRTVVIAGEREALPNPLRRMLGDWETVRPRVPLSQAPGGPATAEDRTNSAFGLSADDAGPREGGQPLQADPATCAAHLLRYLSHHGLLPRPAHVPLSGAQAVPASPSAGSAPCPVVSAPPEELTPLSTRTPRLAGASLAGRHWRQPRRLETLLQTAAIPAETARRPRRTGESGTERRRGPRRNEAGSTPDSTP